MALIKTVGVLLIIGLVLWAVFAVVHFLAGTILVVIELLIVAAIALAVYRYFNKKKAE
jgi:hypothetical protein